MVAIVGALPNTIANGQALDATPVMADFNWIVSQVNANAAALANPNAFTAVQSGVAANVAAAFPIVSQIQAHSFTWCGVSGGTANAITLTPAPAIAAYQAGQEFIFQAGLSNSGATTVAISGLATLAVQVAGAACIGGELIANKWYKILVDASGTSAQLSWIGSPATAYKAISFTRDISLASGTQAVTGVGFKPRGIIFLAGTSAGTANIGSWGVDDGTTHLSLIWFNASSANGFATSAAASIYANPVAGSNYQGYAQSFDADGFTISWTKGGTPTGTLTVQAICFR